MTPLERLRVLKITVILIALFDLTVFLLYSLNQFHLQVIYLVALAVAALELVPTAMGKSFFQWINTLKK